MNRALPTWLLLFSLVLIFACNQDDPTAIGAELIGSEEELLTKFTNSLEIEARLIRIDSVQSGLQGVSGVRRPSLIGAIEDDPVFGSSFAGVYMQFAPLDAIAYKSDNLVFDSLHLIMDYINIAPYGDTLSLQNWVVYELDEQIDSTRWYSNENFAVKQGYELGRMTDFKLEPLAPFGPDSLDSQLRIDLSDSDLGPAMVDILSDQLDSTFVFRDQFKEFFKGVYIAPDTTLANNSMATLDVVSSVSGILLYYRDLDVAEEESQGQVLAFVGGIDTCHLVNHFEHNYLAATNPVITDHLATPDVPLSEYVYLQGHSGLQVEIDFPNFDEVLNPLGNGVIINKAELVLTHIANTANLDSIYVPPLNVDLRTPVESIPPGVEDSGLWFINDYQITSNATVNELDTLNTTVTTYTYNLNLFFQDLVDASPEDRKVRISVSNRAIFFNERRSILADDYMMERVILAGPEYPDEAFRMKVNLYYTEIVP